MIKPSITTRVTAILAVLGSMVQDPDGAAAADWKVPDRAPLLTPWASEVSLPTPYQSIRGRRSYARRGRT